MGRVDARPGPRPPDIAELLFVAVLTPPGPDSSSITIAALRYLVEVRGTAKKSGSVQRKDSSDPEKHRKLTNLGLLLPQGQRLFERSAYYQGKSARDIQYTCLLDDVRVITGAASMVPRQGTPADQIRLGEEHLWEAALLADNVKFSEFEVALLKDKALREDLKTWGKVSYSFYYCLSLIYEIWFLQQCAGSRLFDLNSKTLVGVIVVYSILSFL